MSFAKQCLTFCLLIFVSINAFALPFSIVPKQPLPTQIVAGGTTTAFYTVSNNTGSQRNNNTAAYLPLNVSQVDSGGFYSDTCGQSFSLSPAGQPGSSCTLQLTITGPVDASDPEQTHHLFVCFPGKKTCSGTNYPLNVSQQSGSLQLTPAVASIQHTSTQQYQAILYSTDGSSQNVTNSATYTSSNPTVATISPTGLASGVNAGQATITASYSSILSNAASLTVTKKVVSLVISPTVASTLRVAYSQQFTATATYDDGSTGDISSQVNWVSANPSAVTISSTGLATGVALGSSTISASYPSVVSASATATVVRFAYFGGGTSCQLDTSANFTNCTSVSNFGGTGAAVNRNGTYAYFNFYSGSNILSYCTISPSGNFTSCAMTTAQPGSEGTDIAVNPAGTFLYITNGNFGADIYSCPINQTTGNIASCTTNPVSGTGSGTDYISVSPNGKFIYFSSTNSTIAYAPLNSDGTIGTISTTGIPNGFIFSGLAIDPTGNYLYVLNVTGGTSCSIVPCTLNPNTGIPSCTTNGTGIPCSQADGLAMDPLGIYLYVTNLGTSNQACQVSGLTISNCNAVTTASFRQLAIR